MHPSNRDSDILQQLEAVNVWRRGSQRAPHKPLLLLLTLASVLRGEARQQSYGQIDDKLRRLLHEFGPYHNHWKRYLN